MGRIQEKSVYRLVPLKGDFGRFLQAIITLNDFSDQLLSVYWEMELRHNKDIKIWMCRLTIRKYTSLLRYLHFKPKYIATLV